jgi:drug/metabolite transporter (DMT)-like permease
LLIYSLFTMIWCMGIFLAFLSMACAAGNDVVYRQRAKARVSAPHHLLIVSLVWTTIFLPVALFRPWGHAALEWGILSGIAGLVAHMLLLGAMRSADMSVCATIYRLNLIPATLVSVLAFDEHLTAQKIVAISCSSAAVALLAGGTGELGKQALLLSGSACLMRAGMSLGYKQGLEDGVAPSVILALNGLSWAAGSLAWVVVAPGALREGWTMERLGWGSLSGCFISGNVLFLTLALSLAPLSTVLPISQLSFALTALIGWIFLHEHLNGRRWASIGCAIFAVLLLCSSR